MKYSFVIKSSTALICVNCDKNIYDDLLKEKFLYSYIPSVEIFKNCDNYTFDANLYVILNNKEKVKISYPNAFLYAKTLNLKDVVTLAEYLLERARQEKNVICIHGACAIVNELAVVSWGTATGMGKTTLALELSKQNNSFFYSEEKILIDLHKKNVVGQIKNQYVSNDFWKSKYGNCDYSPIKNVSSNIIYPIGLFIHPLICNQIEYNLDEWDSGKFLWNLYEESSRKIRGTSRLFFNFSYPIKSLDTQHLAKKRLELIKRFVKNIQSYYYKGNINNICLIVNNILNKKI